MVRGLASGTVITGVDDSFTMKMYFHEIGDYEMINHIVEYEANQRISWEPEAGNGHPGANTANARWGHRWTYALTPEGARTTIVTETYDFSRVSEHNMGRIGDGRHSIEAMANSLERLDALCTQAGTAAQAEAPVGRVPEAPVQGNR